MDFVTAPTKLHLTLNLLIFITDFWQFCHKSVAKIGSIPETSKFFRYYFMFLTVMMGSEEFETPRDRLLKIHFLNIYLGKGEVASRKNVVPLHAVSVRVRAAPRQFK